MLTDKKGFTLIEILVATFIFALVSTAIYNVFIKTSKTAGSQRLSSEMRQNARASLEYMTGELNRLGYGIPADNPDSPTNFSGSTVADTDKGPKLVYASSGELVFAYKFGSSVTPEYRLVRYYASADEIKRTQWEWNSATTDWDTGWDDRPLVDNVKSLSFAYFSNDSLLVSVPLDFDDRASVRRIKIVITTEQAKADPVSGVKKEYTLETEVAVINMGTETVADSTAPPVPTLTSVVPRNICGTLDVNWTESSAADLSGYIIHINSGGNIRQYTALPTATSARVGGLRTYADSSGNISYTYPIANGTPATIKVAAYDSAGNGVDAWSNEISATPNVDAPQQPQGLDSSADTDNIYLTWTDNAAQYADCGIGDTNCDNDVGGYKVFRKYTGAGWDNFTTVPGTTYTDSISAQNRCITYEYKIQAVNRCDNSLVSADSATAYGDAGLSGGITDSPADGTTNTRASDSTAPDKPTVTASKAGYRRDYINWDNPADTDLDSIIIHYNKLCDISSPSSPTSTDEGTPVEDVTDGTLSPETPGATTRSFTHSGSIDGTPSLGNGCTNNIATYAYSLFAVDKCGNESAYDPTAVTTVAQCGEALDDDDPRTPCQEGAPSWASLTYLATVGQSCISTSSADFTVSDSCGSNYEFTWNRIDDAPTAVWDMAGYYVYRKETTASWTPSSSDTGTKSSGLILNPGSGSADWTDDTIAAGDDSNLVGNTYKYYAIPIDCNREANHSSNPWSTVAPSFPDAPNPESSNTLTVMPGRVTFTNPVSTGQLGTYPEPSSPYVTAGELTIGAGPNYTPSSDTNYLHNTAQFYVYNTSAADVDLDSLTLFWNYSAAYLNSVKRLDDGSCIWGTDAGCTQTVADPLANSATIAPDIELKGISGATCPTPPCTLQFELEFTDPTGTATSEQDMRNKTIDVSSLSYTKEFLSDDSTEVSSACSVSNPVTYTGGNDDIVVPLGPVVNDLQETYALTFAEPSQTSGNHNIASTNAVNIVATIEDTSGSGISKAVLYYATSKQNRNTPPGPGWSAKLMYQTGVNTYKIYDPDTPQGSELTGTREKRMWYYMLIQDNEGNWTRWPEISDTVNAYTYDMDDPCGTTSLNPTGLVLTNSPTVDVDGSGNVNLEWDAPIENTVATGGEALTDLDGFNIYESTSDDKGVSWTTFANVGSADGETAGATYTYARSTSDHDDGTWLKYYVTAYDSCGTPKESTASGTVGTVYKGTCAAVPGTTSMEGGSWNMTAVLDTSTGINYQCTGSLCYQWALNFDMPTDTVKDIAGLNIYYRNPTGDWAGPPATLSATTNTGYSLRAAVTLSDYNTTCNSTLGTCSISGTRVTVQVPVISGWLWYDGVSVPQQGHFNSIRAFDYCNQEGDRGTEQ